MTARYRPDVLAKRQEVVGPPEQRSCTDHGYGLPTGIYWLSAAFFVGFVAVTSIGFAQQELVVPMGIIVFFLAMFFAVPALFVRLAPKAGCRSLSWAELRESGIDTATGRTSGFEAAVLVLMLPFLVFCWGIVAVIIASLV